MKLTMLYILALGLLTGYCGKKSKDEPPVSSDDSANSQKPIPHQQPKNQQQIQQIQQQVQTPPEKDVPITTDPDSEESKVSPKKAPPQKTDDPENEDNIDDDNPDEDNPDEDNPDDDNSDDDNSDDQVEDTTPPPLTITGPANNSHVLNGFILSGECEDGLTIETIFSSLISPQKEFLCENGGFSAVIDIREIVGTITHHVITLSQTDSSGNTTTLQLNLTSGSLLPPSRISFQGPASVLVGDCANFDLVSENEFGYISPLISNEHISLLVNNGSGNFFTDEECLTNLSEVELLQGESTREVFFKSDATPQSLTLVAIPSDLHSHSTTLNIADTPNQLSLVSAPNLLTNQCLPLAVKSIDSSGFEASVQSELQLEIIAGENLNVFSDSQCQLATQTVSIENKASSAEFYIYTSQSGANSLTLSSEQNLIPDYTISLSFSEMRLWWHTDWKMRRPIRIKNLDQTSSHTDQVILLRLKEPQIQFNHFENNGEDLRIVANDHQTLLDYEITQWNKLGESHVWVKVPYIERQSNNNFIYLYYGNSAATAISSSFQTWAQYSSVWHLDDELDSDNNSIANAQGNTDFNGVTINSPSAAAAPIGSGINLMGDFDGFLTATDLSPVLGSSSTISLWIKTGSSGHSISWRAPGITGVESEGDGNDIFFAWIDDQGRLGVTAGNGGSAKSQFVVNNQVWRHVTISRNHLNGTVKFYVNGVLNGQGRSDSGSKTTPFYQIGYIEDTAGTPEEFDGYLDEIRIYNGVLSDDQIKADFKYMLESNVTIYPSEEF